MLPLAAARRPATEGLAKIADKFLGQSPVIMHMEEASINLLRKELSPDIEKIEWDYSLTGDDFLSVKDEESSEGLEDDGSVGGLADIPDFFISEAVALEHAGKGNILFSFAVPVAELTVGADVDPLSISEDEADAVAIC